MTSRLFLPAAALATAAVAHDAPADPPDVQAHYSETFTECTRDSMATADTVFCIASEAKHQEPKLEQAYVAALKRAAAKRKPAIRSAQVAWRKKAQADCDAAAAGEQYERIAQATRGQCMLDATIRRTIELERKR